jgi:hypothetical protein
MGKKYRDNRMRRPVNQFGIDDRGSETGLPPKTQGPVPEAALLCRGRAVTSQAPDQRHPAAPAYRFGNSAKPGAGVFDPASPAAGHRPIATLPVRTSGSLRRRRRRDKARGDGDNANFHSANFHHARAFNVCERRRAP